MEQTNAFFEVFVSVAQCEGHTYCRWNAVKQRQGLQIQSNKTTLWSRDTLPWFSISTLIRIHNKRLHGEVFG